MLALLDLNLGRAGRLALFSGLASALASTPVFAVCNEPVLFSLHTTYSTGPRPFGIVATDFSGDGILDLAVAASANAGGTPGVALLRGQGVGGVGDGTFAPPQTFNAGTSPWGLAAGDFNEDGRIDVAATSGHSISILAGTPSGFAAPVSFPVGSGTNPFHVVTGDFNEDGILDLATACSGEASVRVLLGLGSGGVGNGTFGSATAFSIPGVANGIASGDFDEDGITDLVATCAFQHIVALLPGLGTGSTGNGAFGAAVPLASTGEPYAVAVADLNEDGHLDLIAGDGNLGGLAVSLGNGIGGFTSTAVYNSGTQNATIVAADMNDDGILDLVSGDGRNLRVHVLLGQGSGGVGNGSFSGLSSYPVGVWSLNLTVGDFDENGSPDAATANHLDANVSVLLGTCEAPPPPPNNAPTLTDVRDVPHDQGGRVFVTWLASALDAPGGSATGYRVWRRIHPAGTAAGRAGIAAFARRDATIEIVRHDALTEYWEAIAELPAQHLAGYGYTAATTQDSMPDSNPYTAFFVTALTNNAGVFYNSNVDSGYSADNLPPEDPDDLAGTAVVGGYQLMWTVGLEPDIDRFRIYRGTSADFPLDPEHRIGETEVAEWIDAGAGGADWYKVSVVDRHENEGPPAVLSPIALDVGDAPLEFALFGATPNPARSSAVTVAFTLPSGAPARIEMYDLSGRRVADQDVGSLGAGRHRVDLGARGAVPAGVFWLRLVQGPLHHNRRIVVVP